MNRTAIALVAIILAALAVPRLYTWYLSRAFVEHGKQTVAGVYDYIAKADSSEAQTELRKLQFFEMQFFKRYHTYTTDLVSLGWAPWQRKRIYKIGFVLPSRNRVSDLQSHDPSRKDSDVVGLDAANEPVGFTFAQAASLCPRCTADDGGFSAIAVGLVPYKDGDHRKIDAWTIDQDGREIHLTE